MPNEHPILFSGEMVKVILEGRKTQTRRVIKPQPVSYHPHHVLDYVSWKTVDCKLVSFPIFVNKYCPYGQAGDLLWVRETWATICKVAIPYCECETEADRKENHYIEYRADTGNPYPGDWPEDEARGNDEAPKWKSPYHMPRWASRITLEIVSVCVERVQDITGADVASEGVEFPDATAITTVAERWKPFRDLWDSINAKRGYGWDANPWVWVLEFKVIK